MLCRWVRSCRHVGGPCYLLQGTAVQQQADHEDEHIRILSNVWNYRLKGKPSYPRIYDSLVATLRELQNSGRIRPAHRGQNMCQILSLTTSKNRDNNETKIK